MMLAVAAGDIPKVQQNAAATLLLKPLKANRPGVENPGAREKNDDDCCEKKLNTDDRPFLLSALQIISINWQKWMP